jgi:hypothetical protein
MHSWPRFNRVLVACILLNLHPRRCRRWLPQRGRRRTCTRKRAGANDRPEHAPALPGKPAILDIRRRPVVRRKRRPPDPGARFQSAAPHCGWPVMGCG